MKWARYLIKQLLSKSWMQMPCYVLVASQQHRHLHGNPHYKGTTQAEGTSSGSIDILFGIFDLLASFTIRS